MARLDGQKPNVGAIILSAVIFALVAGGLFFAFRPVPEPTDAGLSNSAKVEPTQSETNATGEGSGNSLATILTPLPTATPIPTPMVTEPMVAPDETASARDNAATLPDGNAMELTANVAATN